MRLSFLTLALLTALPLASAQNALTVYSGRSESLVGPLLEQFKRANPGISVRIRYGDSAQLAATLLEEGSNSPADVFFSQDAGALGALSKEGRLAPLPASVLGKVNKTFTSPRGEWVGVSGRARVIAYNTRALSARELPQSVLDLTDPRWKGKIGWAPTNASFQALVTALRKTQGEARAEAWLRGVRANNPRVYKNNTAVLEALGRGEVQLGLVNHYYLYNFLKDQGPDFPVRNAFMRAGDAGNLVNVAGAGVLKSSRNRAAAERFVNFLLSKPAQEFFARQTYEYPLAAGVRPAADLLPLAQIRTPDMDLSDLDDLKGTVALLQKTGVL
ncbi:iron(III) transport system substrate-binding protein [Deinobacterium chartae]|uniref:Iron(III) transport system substrate-binding protein n=1 Tax=Deinobacterium chartae TaxID=521158 RepID=A0A841I253_9DEIO|nr:iron ABC transporter substrate-binding protein [Deinobacterium chartae]MBB6098132.1 iron(III) transport system substrate-binding protein [Deinobacterium chartae]